MLKDKYIETIVDRIVEKYGSMSLNKEQAGEVIGCKRAKIDNMRKSGEIKFKVIGGAIRFSALDLAKMLA